MDDKKLQEELTKAIDEILKPVREANEKHIQATIEAVEKVLSLGVDLGKQMRK
jgi:hypothetical protein